jgi:hypothetical protein
LKSADDPLPSRHLLAGLLGALALFTIMTETAA